MLRNPLHPIRQASKATTAAPARHSRNVAKLGAVSKNTMNKLRQLIIISFACLLAITRSSAEEASFDAVINLVATGNVDKLRRVIEKNPEAVHLLNPNGLPLIHRAVMTDKTETVSILIDAGAKLDSVDGLRRTPLHVAAGWSTLAMVELLWKKGANPKATTERGDTPLDFANDNFYQDKKVEREKIKAFLTGKGAVMSEGEEERQQVIKEVEDSIASRPDKGPEPRQSEFDGSVDLITIYVREVTNDPSPKFEEWSKVSSLGDKWAVRARFTYKNSAGASQQANRWFYVVDGKVVSTKPAQ